jgi:hypothetical protein
VALVYATLASAQPPLPTLSASVPADVDTRGVDLRDFANALSMMQAAFDEFSWRSLVALSWPAGPGGTADPARRIGERGDAPTVWEHWPLAEDVFPPPPAVPRPWGAPPTIPLACRPASRALSMFAKAPVTPEGGILAGSTQALNTGPLIDRNGEYVRYSVQLNRDAFDYVVSNRLYNTVGQTSLNPISFPAGSLGTNSVGAITIKAAWKVLGAGDDPNRFHKMTAWAYTPAGSGTAESCVPKHFGLVGLHLAHKTASRPQWIWSTFEQVDNAPPGDAPRSASFYDVACTGEHCKPNVMSPRPWRPATKGIPTQVTRLTPIPGGTAAVNTRWQAALRHVDAASPWQYYMLVGTQWPTAPDDPDGIGLPTPPTLANAVIETFIQQGGEGAASSCIHCHRGASVSGRTSQSADYSYLLQRAATAGRR